MSYFGAFPVVIHVKDRVRISQDRCDANLHEIARFNLRAIARSLKHKCGGHRGLALIPAAILACTGVTNRQIGSVMNSTAHQIMHVNGIKSNVKGKVDQRNACDERRKQHFRSEASGPCANSNRIRVTSLTIATVPANLID